MLKAEMRNGLAQKLTFTITNHEMRLRALEDKPAVTPPTPSSEGKCVGEYQDGTEINYVGKKVPRSSIRCYGMTANGWADFSSYHDHFCEHNDRWRGEIDLDEWNHRDNYEERHRRRENRIIRYSYWWFQDRKFFGPNRCLNEKGVFDFDSCRYYCGDKYQYNPTYCEIKESPIMKSCSEFNKVACKAKSGCTWQG